MTDRIHNPFLRLTEEAPCLRLLVPLMLGIAIAECDIVPEGAVWFVTGVGVLCLAWCAVMAYVRRFRKPRWADRSFLLAICVVFVSMGFVSDMLMRERGRVVWPDDERRWRGIVTEPVRETDKTYRFMLVLDGDGGNSKVVLSVMKYAVDSVPKTGDAVEFDAQIKQPYNYIASDFDYARWLERQGVSGMAFTKDRMKTLTASDADSLREELPLLARVKAEALKFRQRLLSHYETMDLDSQEFAVVSAITLGDKTGLRKDTRSAFSDAGASHVLALSGLHLGIIVMFVMLILKPMRQRRWGLWAQSLLCVVMVWCFVLLTGGSVSVTRSAIMLTLMILLGLRGEGFSSLNNVALAAFTILLLNPASLADLGFQLSFLAVFALVYFLPYYIGSHWRSKAGRWGWIMDFFFVTIVAQTATAPLVACVFGKVPLMFLLTNMVVIPCTYVLLLGALCFLALSWLPVVSGVIGMAVKMAVSVMIGSVEWISKLPFSSIDVRISEIDCVLLYPLLFVLAVYIVMPRRRYLHWAILLLGMFVSALVWGV